MVSGIGSAVALTAVIQFVDKLWELFKKLTRDEGLLVALVTLAPLLFGLLFDPILKDYRANYATARFTSIGWKILSKFFNTSDIQNLHWDINCWGDEEVKAWKNNCISGYGAVAVAVRRRIWTQYFISV